METEKHTQEQLLSAGGKLWEQGAHRRVYFNNGQELLGLTYTQYKTGNISSAQMGGEQISNSEARRILGGLRDGKLYYCLVDQRFKWRDLPCGLEAKLIAAIEERITKLAEAR